MRASCPLIINQKFCSCNLFCRNRTRGLDPRFFEATRNPHSSSVRLNTQTRGLRFYSKTQDPHPCEVKQHDTRILQTRVSVLKRDVRVLVLKRETHVQSVPECDSYVPTTKHKDCVLKQTLPKCEAQTRVSSQKCKIHVQSGMSLKHTKLKSPHPEGFEASPLDTRATDLRDYLTKKRSIHQITLQCCCE